METRLQTVNEDTVLEITEAGSIKTRLSKTALLRRKGYFEEAIARFREGLADVDAKLALIDNEQAKQTQ